MKVAKTNKLRKNRADVFKALGNPVRLQIVETLSKGERCVCELVELVSVGWSAVSRHLSVLKEAGILTDAKRGQQVYYRLAMPCVATVLDCLDAAKRGELVKIRRRYR